MSDIWYFRSDIKVLRQLPINLQWLNFRIFFPLNYTIYDQFFHVGNFFYGFRKKLWLITTPLTHCVSRLQNKENWENNKCVINASQICLKREAKWLISNSSKNYGCFVQDRNRQHVMASWWKMKDVYSHLCWRTKELK